MISCSLMNGNDWWKDARIPFIESLGSLSKTRDVRWKKF